MADTESKTTITDELKAAAAKLRRVAGLATYGPWRRAADVEHASGAYGPNHVANWDGEYLTSVADAGEGLQAVRDAAWICLANPLLAEPLAVWLESAASEFITEEWTDCPTAARAVAVARVVNGTTPEEAALHG